MTESRWSPSLIHFNSTNLPVYHTIRDNFVESLSCVPLFVTPWTVACWASLFFTISWRLLRLMSIESMMPSNRLILCRSILLLPSVFLSIRVFSNELILHIRWPKFWSFSFSINPSNEYPGLISFRIDWFDLLAVQGALKSLLQHHNLKASSLHQCFIKHQFFMVQLSHANAYWENHSFDYTDLGLQRDVSAFLYAV